MVYHRGMALPALTIGTKYLVTYDASTDPRRAAKFATRTFTVADAFTLADGKTYYKLAPVRGYHVTVAATEITDAVAV